MISLIIPVFNEEEALQQTLDAATKTLDQSGFESEIIVVNDGSTDATAAILQLAKKTAGITVVKHASNKGNGASIVSGIAVAHGDTVCTVDAAGTALH